LTLLRQGLASQDEGALADPRLLPSCAGMRGSGPGLQMNRDGLQPALRGAKAEAALVPVSGFAFAAQLILRLTALRRPVAPPLVVETLLLRAGPQPPKPAPLAWASTARRARPAQPAAWLRVGATAASARPWLQLCRAGPTHRLGSLYPEPAAAGQLATAFSRSGAKAAVPATRRSGTIGRSA